jgi:ribonuclease Z
MSIVFIGTSSGRTSLSRFHSALFIDYQNSGLLVDAGDGVSKALLNSNKKYDDINYILLIHFHADHFGGIAALITQMKIYGRTLPLKIFTNAGLKNTLLSYLNSCYLFMDRLGFNLNVLEVEENTDVKLNQFLSFILRRNNHLTRKTNVQHDDIKFISSSCLFIADNKNIFYTSDIGSAEDLEIFNNYHIDILISETTHIQLDSIIEFADKFKIKNIYLTHIDEPSEKKIIDWAEKIRSRNKINIQVAEDGMIINLSDVF